MKSEPNEALGTSCYDASGSKKGPILAVYWGDIDCPRVLQFPIECKYEFREVAGSRMLVVMGADGGVVAHIKQCIIHAVVGPQYLIRDADAR